MITGHVFIATSLDGFIARANDDLDWLEIPGIDGENHGYDDFIDRVDGIIMGRGSYEKVRTFGIWPYKLPVHVLSSSLPTDTPAPADNVTFGRETPEGAMQACHKKGWRRAYIDGGKVIQSFLRAGLIEDMIISRIPILLGSGKPLFGHLDTDIRLKHQWSRDFPSGLTQSSFQVIK